MKEAVGGFSLFNIVIVFVILFTGYICLSINHSKAYSIKNELLTIIKNQGGVCSSDYPSNDNNCYNFTELVSSFLRDVGYHSTGRCTGDEIGFNRNGLRDDTNAAFCVVGVKSIGNNELPNAVYYKIRVFFQIDLPIFSSIFNFSVSGETGRVYSPNECIYDTNYSWCS